MIYEIYLGHCNFSPQNTFKGIHQLTDKTPTLEKCLTGITGFDEISNGGLPRGRSTLLAGQAGAGKTLFALQFVLHGIEQYQEPGVFVSFEETPGDLAVNIASLGVGLRYNIKKDVSARFDVARVMDGYWANGGAATALDGDIRGHFALSFGF